jgi:hypothetical protein
VACHLRYQQGERLDAQLTLSAMQNQIEISRKIVPFCSRIFIFCCIISGLAACAARQRPIVAWREDMERLFPNSSVRPNEPPRRLWTRQEEDLFQLRVGSADYVARGTFRLISIYSTFNSPKQLAVGFRPQNLIYGDLNEYLDKDGELMLQLTPASEEFRLAVQLQKSLPGNRFIVLLKEKEGSDGQRVLRWATYNEDPEVIAEIRTMYTWLKRYKRQKKR